MLTDPVNGVGNVVTAAPADQAQQVYYEAATALQTIPYAVAGPGLSAIAASNQVPARLWALYSLFSMVDFENETAKADFLASVKAILVNPPPGLAFPVSMLANAIEGHLKSPKAVPTLAALLGSTQVEVRSAAAAALGDIATPDVVEPLAKVALNDSDEQRAPLRRARSRLGNKRGQGSNDRHLPPAARRNPAVLADLGALQHPHTVKEWPRDRRFRPT